MERWDGKAGEAAQSWGRDLGTWETQPSSELTLSQIAEKLQQVFFSMHFIIQYFLHMSFYEGTFSVLILEFFYPLKRVQSVFVMCEGNWGGKHCE